MEKTNTAAPKAHSKDFCIEPNARLMDDMMASVKQQMNWFADELAEPCDCTATITEIRNRDQLRGCELGNDVGSGPIDWSETHRLGTGEGSGAATFLT